MKVIPYFLLLICTFNLCKAQYISAEKSTYKIVHQDTINIRGVVYDASGQPVPSVIISSKNKQIIFDGYPVYTVTDSIGSFKLQGALVKDTLEFMGENLSIINNGSRYIEVHLPQQNESHIIIPGAVTARRQTNKNPPPVFKVQTDVTIMDYYGIAITADAVFRAGYQKFVDYIRSKIIYPEKAIKNNIEGDVEASFIIDRYGVVKEVKIVRGIGYGCDEAVVNAFINCPNWKPEIIMGHSVASRSSVTINFKLTDK